MHGMHAAISKRKGLGRTMRPLHTVSRGRCDADLPASWNRHVSCQCAAAMAGGSSAAAEAVFGTGAGAGGRILHVRKALAVPHGPWVVATGGALGGLRAVAGQARLAARQRTLPHVGDCEGRQQRSTPGWEGSPSGNASAAGWAGPQRRLRRRRQRASSGGGPQPALCQDPQLPQPAMCQGPRLPQPAPHAHLRAPESQRSRRMRHPQRACRR